MHSHIYGLSQLAQLVRTYIIKTLQTAKCYIL